MNFKKGAHPSVGLWFDLNHTSTCAWIHIIYRRFTISLHSVHDNSCGDAAAA